ncbi:MAG: DNRLRE domain-containing protein [bacterium]
MKEKKVLSQRLVFTEQSGFALAMVLVTVFILEMVCFFLAQSRGIQTMMAFNRIKKVKALYLAEAGLAHGLWQLAQDPNWRAQMTDLSLGDGSYTVSFTEDIPRHCVSIDSRAVAQGTKSSAGRNVFWLTIQPQSSGIFRGEDTYISDEHEDDKYEDNEPKRLMLDSETNKLYRTLVRFDLGKYPLPADAAIVSSRFSLYLFKGPSDDPLNWPQVSYRLHRITNRWIDLETTWRNRYNYHPWAAPGGDFNAGSEDSRTFTDLGWQTWHATGLTRFWMKYPSSNYGLILEASSQSGNYEYRFHSSANTTNPALSPKLTVYYLDWRRP